MKIVAEARQIRRAMAKSSQMHGNQVSNINSEYKSKLADEV